MFGFRGPVQVKDVNAPRTVGGVVGLKMLEMPCDRTLDAFFLSWCLGGLPKEKAEAASLEFIQL